MFEHTTHINGTTRYLRLFLVLLVGALVAGALTVTPSPASPTGYHWPVKPFTSEHPVRGNFGDPRTVSAFRRPPRAPSTGGELSVPLRRRHRGARRHAGLPRRFRHGQHPNRPLGGVSCSDGRSFQYWHISPAVRVGDHVTAFKTVLGRILPGAMHVHFTEFQGGRPVNPLQPGHLTPYTDR